VYKLYFLLSFLLISSSLLAQSPSDSSAQTVPKRIELIQAGLLEGDVLPSGEPIRIINKDSVSQILFRHENTLLYCDTAQQFLAQNMVIAWGNILLVEGDSLTLTGDSLYYFGDSRLAQVRGEEVVMQDSQVTVVTQFLDYEMTQNLAYYFNGGTVKDDSTTLTSDFGYYNTQTKISSFKGNVHVRDNLEMDVKSDSLTYNTNNKVVYFNSQTQIKTRDGSITAGTGSTYNTALGKSNIVGKDGRSQIETKDFLISADVIDYDNLTEEGIARGKVKVFNKDENLSVYGESGNYYGLEDRFEMFKNVLLVKPLEEDTLYLSADTLISRTDSLKKNMYAYRNVKIYKSDLQGRCDSLAYNLSDSMMTFYHDPVLWAGNNQMSAEMIKAFFKDNTVNKMTFKQKSFIIAKNPFQGFNQIKGRDMDMFFVEGDIKKVDVKGNGESIYFVADEKKRILQGMNRIKCSDITMYFADSSTLEQVVFLKSPEGVITPPHLFQKDKQELQFFNWRIEERPTFGSITNNKSLNASNSVKTAGVFNPSSQNKSKKASSFSVFFDDNKVTYFKKDVVKADLEAKFFLNITPVSKKDLTNKEDKKLGFMRKSFRISDLFIKNGVINYSLDLPKFKIKKIVTGQRQVGRGALWQVVQEFNQ
jgi:lipopolysaccharide export system protein LptA